MEIATIAYNRPDFIELQYKTLKRWVKNFNYTVFDNSDTNDIENMCKKLKIKTIKVSSSDIRPAWRCCDSASQMWEVMKKKKGIFMLIDSDMFLTAPLPDMNGYDYACIPTYRDYLTGYYPAFFLQILNLDTLPHLEEIDWGMDNRVGSDVGIHINTYLQKYQPKILELDLWTLIDRENTSNGRDTIIRHTNFDNMISLCIDNEFPEPYAVDKICIKGQPIEKNFAFHYKSGSNYTSFATVEYNRLKTIALFKLFNFIPKC